MIINNSYSHLNTKKSQTNSREQGSALVVIFFIVLVFGIVFATWHFVHDRNASKAASALQTTGSSQSASSTNSGSSTNGTDNTSLSNSLTSVNGSINTENTDTNSSNAAINDQQNQISVPTN